MEFVHASLLAGLAAVALPVIVHLFFRRRARPVDLGTLRFLKIAVRNDTRRRAIKRWILLLLRIACVVLLVFMFARPYRAEFAGGGSTGLTVLLIDRSASMGRQRDGTRLVDHALRELPSILARIPANSRVEAAWFDTRVEPMGASEDDGRGTLSRAEAPATLIGGTDFATALTWAGARCNAARGSGPLSVHVVTDLQRSGFGSLEEFAFPKDVPVRVWDVGVPTSANVAVTEVRPVSLMVPADRPTTVQASVLNARPTPLDHLSVRLKLANGGKVVDVPAVAAASPGATATVSFETPPLSPGLWQGTVSFAAEDDLPLDNARHVAIYAAAKPRVLLLDGAARDVAALGEGYFLEAALRLAPPGDAAADGPFQVAILPYTSGARLPDLSQVDVLVAADVAGFPAADAAKIREFLKRGGGAVVLGGNNLGPASTAQYAVADLSVGEVAGTHAARDQPFRVSEFAADDPVLAPFADPQHGDLRRLTFSGCTRVVPAAGVRVLARLKDGTPLLLERPAGSKRVLWWAAAAGREHGEWSRSRLFLPLVHQLVRGAAGVVGAGPVRDLPAAGEVPGVKQVGDAWEVRNLEPQESDLDRCTAEEFASRLGVTPATDSDSLVAEENKPGDESRTGEWWPWLWLALVVCWVLEGLLANRTIA
ncbi:vWA domain-containing protein [Fimbriiglobus ruber]|uniref:Aerotolerance regulator N-terminal domain-containing protein n=1 Tax=Fimbriiglobus ruber TaxID=1908690 RepID=A0A225E3R6_9BACT|nr:BatA and WFA domain-containing protein [Fimbriiglobus ruber]OWK43037.1 hypothetical protein FRUB_02636 [Fimbriiglobus ruber]